MMHRFLACLSFVTLTACGGNDEGTASTDGTDAGGTAGAAGTAGPGGSGASGGTSPTTGGSPGITGGAGGTAGAGTGGTGGTGAASGTGGTGGMGAGGTGGGGASGAGGTGGSGAGGGTSGTGGSVDAGTDAAVVCSGTCRDPAPVGWSGPTRKIDYDTSGAAPECPGGFPTQDSEVFSGFSAGAASCDCTCSVAASACSVEVWSESGTCTTSGNRDIILTPNSCNPTAVNGYVIVAPASEAVTCGAPVETANIPTPTFGMGHRLCTGSYDVDGCDGGQQCVPDAGSDALCIWQAGDVACPSGPYTEKTLYHDDYTDDRTCSSCSCTGSPTCAGTLYFRSGPSCTSIGSTVDTLTVGTSSDCSGATVSAGNVLFDADTFGGTCQASGADLTGSAAVDGPVTVCCLP